MTLSWKARRRWALVVLLVGLPVYIVVAVNLVDLFDRPHFLIEFAIFAALGIVWALPFKALFRGVGQPQPEDEREG